MGDLKLVATIGSMTSHTGMVITCSENVFIGGWGVVRLGDVISCPFHGSGYITEASGSVFVNGLRVARVEDKTTCNVQIQAKSHCTLPQVTQAPEVTKSGTLAKNVDKNGKLITSHPDIIDAEAFRIEGSLSDVTRNGTLDTAAFEANLVKMEAAGNLDENGIFRANGGISVAQVKGSSTYYGAGPSNGISGYEIKGNTHFLETKAGISIGQPGAALCGDVNFKVLNADTEFKRILHSGKDGVYGGEIQGKLGASVVSGEVAGTYSHPLFEVKAKGGGDVVAAGAGAGLKVLINPDDLTATVGISGELAALIGLKGDVELTVGDISGEIQDIIREHAPDFAVDGLDGFQDISKKVLGFIFGDDSDEIAMSNDGVITSSLSNISVFAG